MYAPSRPCVRVCLNAFGCVLACIYACVCLQECIHAYVDMCFTCIRAYKICVCVLAHLRLLSVGGCLHVFTPMCVCMAARIVSKRPRTWPTSGCEWPWRWARMINCRWVAGSYSPVVCCHCAARSYSVARPRMFFSFLGVACCCPCRGEGCVHLLLPTSTYALPTGASPAPPDHHATRVCSPAPLV